MIRNGPEQWLGPLRLAPLPARSIAVTSEPKDDRDRRGVAMACGPSLCRSRLTGSNDPFYQESGGNVLYKAYFN